jgi:hypothetical protein
MDESYEDAKTRIKTMTDRAKERVDGFSSVRVVKNIPTGDFRQQRHEALCEWWAGYHCTCQ